MQVSYLISLSHLLSKNIAYVVYFVLYDQHMMIWWSSYGDMMMMPPCQDGLLEAESCNLFVHIHINAIKQLMLTPCKLPLARHMQYIRCNELQWHWTSVRLNFIFVYVPCYRQCEPPWSLSHQGWGQQLPEKGSFRSLNICNGGTDKEQGRTSNWTLFSIQH